MAEKADKKPDAAAAAAAGDKKDAKGAKTAGGGAAALLTKTPVMMGGVMLLEALVLFAGFKFLGAGAPRADAAITGHLDDGTGHGDPAHGGGKSAAADKKKTVEINVLDFKAPNKLSGRTFLYDVSIYLVTKHEHAESVKQTIKDREALIKDRIRTIIAQSDPEKLGGGSEPGLETLRRQVKYQLDEIVGEQMISEVLVPRCIPFRTDY